METELLSVVILHWCLIYFCSSEYLVYMYTIVWIDVVHGFSEIEIICQTKLYHYFYHGKSTNEERLILGNELVLFSYLQQK